MTGGESQPASEGPAQGTAGPVRDVHMSEENLSSSSDESSDRTSNTMVDRKRRRYIDVSGESVDAMRTRWDSGMAAGRAPRRRRPSTQWEQLIGLTWQEKYSLHERKMREDGRWVSSRRKDLPPDIFRSSKWEPIEIERAIGIRRKELLRRDKFDEDCEEFHVFYSQPELAYNFKGDWERAEGQREKDRLWNLPWPLKYREHMERMEKLGKWPSKRANTDGSRPPIFSRASKDPMEQIMSTRLYNLLRSEVFDTYCQEFHEFYMKNTGYDFKKEWERAHESKYYNKLSWSEKYGEHLKNVEKDELRSMDQERLRVILFNPKGRSLIQRIVSERFRKLLRFREKVSSAEIEEFHRIYLEETGFDFKKYLEQYNRRARDSDSEAEHPPLLIETPEAFEIPAIPLKAEKDEGEANYEFYLLKGLDLWKKQCFDLREQTGRGILPQDCIETSTGETKRIGSDVQKWSRIARNELRPESAKMQCRLIEIRRRLVTLLGVDHSLPDPLWKSSKKTSSGKEKNEHGYTMEEICQEHKDEILQMDPIRWINSNTQNGSCPKVFQKNLGPCESLAAVTRERLLASPTFGEQCQRFHDFYWKELGYNFKIEWENHRIDVLHKSSNWVDKFEAHKMQVIKEDRDRPSQPARWQYSKDGSRPKIFKVTATQLEHEISRRRDRLMQRMHIDRDVQEFHDFYHANIGYDFIKDWESNKKKKTVPWIERYNAHKKVIQLEDANKPETLKRWKPVEKGKTLPPVFRKDANTCAQEECAVGKRRDTLLRKRDFDEACREFHEFYNKELQYDFEQDWHSKKNKADPNDEECAEILCDLKGEEHLNSSKLRRNHHQPVKDPKVIEKLKKVGLTALGEKKISTGEVRCRPKLMYKKMFQPPLSERSFPTVVHACIMEDCLKIIVEMLGLVRGHDPVKEFCFERSGYERNGSLMAAMIKVVNISKALHHTEEPRPSTKDFWEFVKSRISDHVEIDDVLKNTVACKSPREDALITTPTTLDRDTAVVTLPIKAKALEDRSKGAVISKFKVNYEKLQEFLKTHSTLPKPRDGDASLASWLRHQRVQYLNNNLRDEPGVMAGLTGEEKRKMLDSLPGWKEYVADAKVPKRGTVPLVMESIPSKYTKLQENIEKHLEILERWKIEEQGKSAISRKHIPPQRCVYNDAKHGETRLGSWIYRFKKNAKKGVSDAKKVLGRIGEILELGENWWQESPNTDVRCEAPPSDKICTTAIQSCELKSEHRPKAFTQSAQASGVKYNRLEPARIYEILEEEGRQEKCLSHTADSSDMPLISNVNSTVSSDQEKGPASILRDLFVKDVEAVSTNDIFQVIRKLADQYCLDNPEMKKQIDTAVENAGFKILEKYDDGKLLYSLARSCVESHNIGKFFRHLVAQHGSNP
ncbi:hypothetical protein PSENEW3_00002771 [Picochlorum sp. SENEW3]|nr:hypothetical protein PSENEW3_00002771 [Picochlorum sp. SENEW3]